MPKDLEEFSEKSNEEIGIYRNFACRKHINSPNDADIVLVSAAAQDSIVSKKPKEIMELCKTQGAQN